VIDRKIAEALRGEMAEFIIAVTLPGTPERFTRTFSRTAVVGRGDDTDLQLSHPLVSRRHAEISLSDDGRFEVRDLASRNGTIVNDQPLRDDACEASGEVRLQIGPYLLLATLPASTVSETLAFDAPRRSTRVHLDKGTHALSLDGAILIEKLTGLEYGLAEVLCDAAPNLVTNTALGDRLWGKGQWDTYMLHNLVRRVRRKLEEAGADGDELILTVPGVGYRIV
jgi:pSer/pThr/pTyr-binding forkhead associated (FHA) protein